VLEHKCGNISETRKEIAKVIMEGLLELTNALSDSTIPDPLRPFRQIGGSRTPAQNSNRYCDRNG